MSDIFTTSRASGKGAALNLAIVATLTASATAAVSSIGRWLLGRGDQNARSAPNGQSGASGACAHGDYAAFAFILKKRFSPDSVEIESNERHQH
jgi:hypothetical protein